MALFSKLFKSTAVAESPRHVVGIDFGSSSVKVVEIEQRDTMLALKTYGELQLGPYTGQELGSVTNPSVTQRIEALVDVMRESKVTGESAVLAMPLSNSFLTIVTIKATEDEDIAPRIPVEARKFIPVPMTEISLDWSELPAFPNTPENVREVLLAAVQNVANKEMHELLDAVEMASQPTEIEVFSTIRACVQSTKETTAVIDLGAQTSKLYITHDGTLRKMHRVFAGGAQATAHLAKQLDVSHEEAENCKRNYSSDGPYATEIKKVIANAFERSFQEFRRVLAEYEERTGMTIDRIVLSGGSSAFPEMQSYARYMLDRETTCSNAFAKIAYPAFLEDVLQRIDPTFVVALGAALREFDT